MSAPATTTRVSTAPAASTAPASTARATTPAATSIGATSLIPTTTHRSTHRQRTTTITSASSVFPTVIPYDPAEERQADSHRTNKILVGIFTSFGVIVIALAAFQLLRCYKRRYRSKNVPLPPPRDSQLGFHSRAVSMYKEYPADLSRPPSMMMRHGSGSDLITPPSVRSNAPSMDIRTDEAGRRSSDPSRAPENVSRDYSPDNSLTGPALVPNDEEMGRRRSPLGSRSGSPANLSPRPPSQAQVNTRPDPRARTARPTSAVSGQRQSTYGAPGAANRNSTYDPSRRSSFYSAGNRGAPHARERVGLMMPQPLAPEVSNYAINTSLASPPGSMRGSRAGSEQDHNQPLVPPRGPRPDSWVVSAHSSTTLADTPVSDAPSQKDGSITRGRDRASRAEI